MPRIVQLSEASNLAIHSLAYLAGKPGEGPISAAEIATILDVSATHLSKVLQRLSRHGLVRSTRGVGGGFALDKPPESVSLLDIVELVDGPLIADGCLLGKPICAPGKCAFKGVLQSVQDQVRAHLDGFHLSDFVLRDELATPAPEPPGE